MKTQFYLVVSAGGAVETRKKKPDLLANQRAMFLTIVIPDAAFRKPPVIQAVVEVPEGAVIQPNEAQVTVEPIPLEPTAETAAVAARPDAVGFYHGHLRVCPTCILEGQECEEGRQLREASEAAQAAARGGAPCE